MVINPNFSDKAKRDLLLIASAKKGSQRAYAELLGYYKESLFFMLLKMVNNREDAEDLTIEAFEKAFRNINNYAPSFAFSTWLFKIATNHGIDFLRSKKIKKRHISIDSADAIDAPAYIQKINVTEQSLNPEEQIERKQKNATLKILLQKLSPDYRKILVMRYFDEYSYIEIAEKLNIPIGTVKARLHRSRELMQSIIKKSDFEKG